MFFFFSLSPCPCPPRHCSLQTMQNPSPPAYSEQTALQTKQPQAQAAPAFDRKVWHGYGGEKGGPWKIGIYGCFEAKNSVD